MALFERVFNEKREVPKVLPVSHFFAVALEFETISYRSLWAESAPTADDREGHP
jgi:hypothetical protein